MTSFPDEAEVQRIAAITEGAARNLQITGAYFRLSAELRARLPEHANWCTFATWASRQAGVTIRHEDLVAALRARLHAAELFRGLLGQILARIEQTGLDFVGLVVAQVTKLGPLQRASEAVARGNKKVFEEIGLEFARFLARFGAIAAISDQELDVFCSALRDGDPPDGQGFLQEAFRACRAAARCPVPKERAEWMLLANLRIGMHEQVRLQPDIRAALDGAVIEPRDLADLLLSALGQREGRIRTFLQRLFPVLATPVRKLAMRAAEEVRSVVRVLVTEHLMVLALDREVVRLGQDLSRPYPADLLALSNPALAALLAGIDPTPDSERGSGAADWADFRERMHFIADLFRAYQQDPGLFAVP